LFNTLFNGLFTLVICIKYITNIQFVVRPHSQPNSTYKTTSVAQIVMNQLSNLITSFTTFFTNRLLVKFHIPVVFFGITFCFVMFFLIFNVFAHIVNIAF